MVLFTSMINQIPSLISSCWCYTKTKKNNPIGLDESIKFSSTNQTFLKVEDKDFTKNSNTAVSLIGTRHQRHPENSTWNFKLKTQANLHGNLPYLNLNMSFFFLRIYHHRLSIGFGHGLNSIFGPFGWLFFTLFMYKLSSNHTKYSS